MYVQVIEIIEQITPINHFKSGKSLNYTWLSFRRSLISIWLLYDYEFQSAIASYFAINLRITDPISDDLSFHYSQ